MKGSSYGGAKRAGYQAMSKFRGYATSGSTVDEVLAAASLTSGSDVPADCSKVPQGFAADHVNIVRGGLLLAVNGHQGLPKWFPAYASDKRQLVLNKPTDFYEQLTGMMLELYGLSPELDARDATNIVSAIVYEIAAEIQATYTKTQARDYAALRVAQYRELLSKQVGKATRLSPAALEVLANSIQGGAVTTQDTATRVESGGILDAAERLLRDAGRVAGAFNKGKYEGLQVTESQSVGLNGIGNASTSTTVDGRQLRPRTPVSNP